MEELKPFAIDGQEFRPICYIRRVDEPEFGCEGRPEGRPVSGSVAFLDALGEHTVPIEESLLLVSRLDDKMWVGSYLGKTVLFGRRGGEILVPNEAEQQWLRQIGCAQ